MTQRAELTFAELIDRGVPLSSAEAAALVLAVWRMSRPVPPDDAILLSSTGEVSARPSTTRTSGPADPQPLARLLHRLLRLDEPGSGERRGRIPGGLLVVLARTLRQIDLPPLSCDAFRDALERFARSDQPVALAAVFWRAARMRPRGSRRLTWGRPAAPHVRRERRTHGPTAAELRHWLRQSEQELFRLRRSRTATFGAAAMLALIVAGILGIGAAIGDRPARAASADVPLPPAVVTRPTVVVENAPRPPLEERGDRVQPARGTAARVQPTRDRASRQPAGDRRARLQPPGDRRGWLQPARELQPSPAAGESRPSRRTVDMVNLPRTPWAVVRRLDTASTR